MMMNSTEPKRSAFPSLPIINNPQAPSRSQREKYGTLFYLGILGLIVLVTLVGWFGYRVWSLRDVWAKIYVLNDAGEPEARRIQAAFSLGHDPRVEQRQLWDLSLRRGLPELARDILAEGIGPELVAEDPQGYVTAVARSPDWPDWLRLGLARPMAYAATRGHAISRERRGDLCRLGGPRGDAGTFCRLSTSGRVGYLLEPSARATSCLISGPLRSLATSRPSGPMSRTWGGYSTPNAAAMGLGKSLQPR